MTEKSPTVQEQRVEINSPLEQMRRANLFHLMGAISHKLEAEPDWEPTVSELKSLFCVEVFFWIKENTRDLEFDRKPRGYEPINYSSEGDDDRSRYRAVMEELKRRFEPEPIEDDALYIPAEERIQAAEAELPWPDAASPTSTSNWNLEAFRDYELDEEISMRDLNFCSRELVEAMLDRMPLEAKADFFTWFMQNGLKFIDTMPSGMLDLYWVFLRMAKHIPLESRVAQELSIALVDCARILGSTIDDEIYDDDIWDLKSALSWVVPHMALGLGLVDLDPQAAHDVRRLMITEYDVTVALNALRQVVTIHDEPAVHKRINEHLARLMGLDGEAILHTNLEGVYASIDFSKYYLSRETAQKRIEVIAKSFEENGVDKNDPILGVATGTGWEGKGLTEWGFQNYIGVDISPANLKTAWQEYPDIHFVRGSWYDPLPSGRLFRKIITEWATELPILDDDSGLEETSENELEDTKGVNIHCTGWSLPHCENVHGLDKIIERMSEIQKVGNILVIDARNPKFGMTRTLIEKYRGVLKENGFDPVEAEKTYYIVDGPPDEDGVTRHYYNRFIPPIEWLIAKFERWGHYELVKRIDDEIPTNHGDLSSTLVFRRISDQEAELRRQQILEYNSLEEIIAS